MKRLALRQVALIVATVALAPAAAHAATDYTWVKVSTPVGEFVDTHTAGTPVSSFAGASGTGQYGQGGASAMARAGAGIIRLSANASATNGNNSGTTNASGDAEARIKDDFVVLAASAPTGSRGTMTIAFSIDGALSAAMTAAGSDQQLTAGAGWYATVNLSDAGLPGVGWSGGQSREWYNDGTQWTGGANGFGRYTLTLPIRFGDPINLDFYALASAESHSRLPNGEVDAVADLGHTIAWGGIASLWDADGGTVSSFSAVSPETGFDYAQAALAPVDEPAAALQLPLGLLVLTGLARRAMQARRVRRSGLHSAPCRLSGQAVLRNVLELACGTGVTAP